MLQRCGNDSFPTLLHHVYRYLLAVSLGCTQLQQRENTLTLESAISECSSLCYGIGRAI